MSTSSDTTISPLEAAAFSLWPTNPNWSFRFNRIVGSAPTGGADFTEAYLALRDVPAGDDQAYGVALTTLSERLAGEAERAYAAGHTVTARTKWLRAANYLAAVAVNNRVSEEIRDRVVTGRREYFRAAVALSDTPVTPVEIPYEGGKTLPGYLCEPAAKYARPRPALIAMGGGDGVAEDVYFAFGAAMVDRGFTVLLLDGPGQGEAMRRGITFRLDWEVPIGRAIDFLEGRKDVDASRIAVASGSMGSFYAARAAAYEHRVAACVIDGPVSTIPDHVLRSPAFDTGLARMTGISDPAEIKRIMTGFNVPAAASKIECPVLIIASDAELAFTMPADARYDPDQWFADNGQRIFDAVPHDRKKLVRYVIGTPGAAHCAADSRVRMHAELGDWLEDVLVTH